jgi:hypothetical protein
METKGFEVCPMNCIVTVYSYWVNTKRDWLICGHAALGKCNVSRRATSEKLLLAPTDNVLHK